MELLSPLQQGIHATQPVDDRLHIRLIHRASSTTGGFGHGSPPSQKKASSCGFVQGTYAGTDDQGQSQQPPGRHFRPLLIQPSLRASTPGNGAHRRTFHAIGRQADLLNHLVENLISTAKIESDTAALADDGEPEPFVLEELTINYAERRVTVASCPVRLTATEYRLLHELSNNAGRVLTQERLLRTA